MKAKSNYEVYCPKCRVSFAPEQKRCIHCGGRTGPRMVDVPDTPPGFDQGALAAEPEVASEAAPEFATGPLIEGADESAESEGRRSGTFLRMAGTLVWVILAIGIGLVRACRGE